MLPLIFAVSACFIFVGCSPISTDLDIGKLETRQATDCNNTRCNASTTCWDELDIPSYIFGWNLTTPTCAGGNDGHDCCQPEEAWSKCFLRLAYGKSGYDCTRINSQSCSATQLSPSLGPSIASKVRYVVQNIVNINQVFTYYNLALQSSGDIASQSGPDLAKFLQGTTPIAAVLNNGNVMKTLVAGLPFWAASSVMASGPQQNQSNVSPAAAQAFQQSLQYTEGVRSILFGAAFNDKDDVSTEPGLISDVHNAGVLLASALSLIMSDVPTFSAWAAHGLYSGSDQEITVNLQGSGVATAYGTYIVGEALSQNHFSATPTTQVTQDVFQKSRTCTAAGDICKDGTGNYYWSETTQQQYQINEPSNWASSSNGKTNIVRSGYEATAFGLFQYLETTNIFMPVLFDGAYNCTLEGKAGGSAVNFTADGSLDVACLSSLPVYLNNGASCPAGAVKVDGKCPFGFNGYVCPLCPGNL